MKASNYDKIISLMDQREKVAYKLNTLKATNRPNVHIKFDGREETKSYFQIWASTYKEASLSEKATAKYIEELKVALAFELSKIDEMLEKL